MAAPGPEDAEGETGPGMGGAPVVFPSKRDGWLVWLLVGSAFAVIAITLNVGAGLLLGLAAIHVALVAAVLLNTRYVITDTAMTAWCGPFRWMVPRHEIRSIMRSRDTRSSPALSLDRLLIDYGAGPKQILVSPEDQEGFAAALGFPLPPR